ncbi:MAG TPA: kynureninase [Bacillota bacterium]|nr:kynureninase [Clostridiaceae bacterium]HNR04422.1 kynureninase [Bacillota bacterium]HNT03433.1 kynureninase [Bacillota bacterium]HPA53624.1 kynureninase [Bacillota bacterium]HPL98927.1 kynureninase [Bacillota bacterium]
MKHEFRLGLDCAKELDMQDPLKEVRNRFYVRKDEIYMDGNSLGLCSKDAEKAVLKVMDVWKEHGIGLWNVEDSKYFLYPSYLGGRMASLINAEANEVTVTNSVTINIHQGIATFYKPTKDKYKILVDDLNFPTDRYAVDSQVKLHGYDPADVVKVVQSPDGRIISEDAVIEAMTDDVALILLPSLLYRSAQLLDMERITKEAHKRGIYIGWDLCHSIGVIPHDFKKINPDFAVWCNYKYMSGGPGTSAGLYINKKHFAMDPGLTGWFGNTKSTQFQLKHQYEHSNDADGWLTGTPPILSMAAIEGVLDIYDEIGIVRIREKSLKITDYLMYLIDERLTKYGYSIGNPREDDKRGGHVALEHQEAYRICQALKRHKVIPDFREPDVIRLAPVALYVSYEDVHRLVDILEELTISKEYEDFEHTRSLVV